MLDLDTAIPQRPAARLSVPRGPATSKRIDLDLARLRAAGFLTPDSGRSQLADEFRVIKRPLIGNAKGRSAGVVQRANMIMVTSAFPGEGKSFTAINLAMSIATELDSTVLLVDGDVAAPGLSGVLGLPKSNGLIEVLTEDRFSLADVLLRTNVEKLSILPAGSPNIRNTELLASQAMSDLLDEIMSRYPDRIVIFDSPPLLPTTESRVLATHMGQIVVVVEADKTSHSAVAQAFAMIESCPVVMTVLNKAAGSEMGRYYGYYQY